LSWYIAKARRIRFLLFCSFSTVNIPMRNRAGFCFVGGWSLIDNFRRTCVPTSFFCCNELSSWNNSCRWLETIIKAHSHAVNCNRTACLIAISLNLWFCCRTFSYES
jgi:hypothetical protein